MKLGVVIPLWKREELTRLTLRRIAREVEGDQDCILVAITNEEINGEQASEYGFEVVSVRNQPLSNKKNAGVQHLKDRVDGVVLLGSDDWAVGLGGVPFLSRYRKILSEHPVVGPLDMWYVDLERAAGGYYEGYEGGQRRGEPVGVGRAMTAEVLDAIKWTPRPPNLQSHHDGAMRTIIENAGYLCEGRKQEELGVRLVDIKSETSVTAFSSLSLMAESWDEALRPFPQEEVADLAELFWDLRRGRVHQRKTC